MHKPLSLLLEILAIAAVLSVVAMIWTAFALPRPSTGWLIAILSVTGGAWTYFRTQLVKADDLIEDSLDEADALHVARRAQL